jgi:hypothetical protein
LGARSSVTQNPPSRVSSDAPAAGGLEPRIFYGDSTGAVVHLRCGPPQPQEVRALASKDYEVLHQDHTDWVTQVLTGHPGS